MSDDGSMMFRARRKIWRYWNSVTHPGRARMRRLLKDDALHARMPREHERPAAAASNYLTKDPPVSEMIPRIVFQTWKSRIDIPHNYRVWRETFHNQNPDFQILLWDDDDNRAFVHARFPWFMSTYDRYPKEIYRADAVRPLFLFLFGGFYADMDTECLRPLENQIACGEVLLGRMGYDDSFAHSIPNAIMASRPYEYFWLFYVQLMMDRAKGMSVDDPRSQRPEALTGPVALYDAVSAFLANPEAAIAACAPIVAQLPYNWQARLRRSLPTILPPEIWYGVDWTNPLHRKVRARIQQERRLLSLEQARALFPEATMVTYWSHSW
ncbi:glycosyltransferase family 32 protein [Sphingomonas sp. 35-24ZXX]|uniref:glycosyltransferase family 32 protein n=1 Tax=Sphingomonas sp. 35-24ZXX TaxID=1545915 RepID=UPI00053BF7C4|nr:glycosyltransferase [Sphingomonas sp. 35-24ZXX]